ncbi:MAG: antitoxin of toxin-antitoxin stability system [Rickettsiales bacterium]|nr:antitoxin of toxin-antitoxin stability system [Rickettsiales bacterium]
MVSDSKKIIICSTNKSITELVTYKTNSKIRKPGKLKGKIKISKDFDELTEEFLKFFN